MHIIGSLISEPDFPDQGGPDDATDSGSGPGTISPQPGPPRVSSMSAPLWMLASNTAWIH